MFPVSANPRARTSKRGGRNRANARNTGTKYDAKPESPGMAFRTRTTSGPKPKPTLFTKYSPQTSPASNRAVRAVTSRCTARTGLCRYTPVTQHPVRHIVHGAVAAYGHDALRPRLHRARRELRAVARPFGALHVHRPPLAVKLARDRVERAGRGAPAGCGVEHNVGVNQRLPL